MDKLTKYTQVEHLQKTNELVDKVNELKPVATSGSYNDLTDTPVLDNDAIIEALGYTPLNADEGGTVNGDVNVTGKYLVNGEELESGINLLKRNKEYAVGDIAFDKNLKSPYHLLCIEAGTTGSTAPENLSSNNLNDQITDGTVKWLVVQYINHLNNYVYVGKEEDINQDLLHENVILVDPDELLDPLSFSEMTGATDSESGMGGTVPAPEAGSSNRFLAADATWKEIDVPDVDLSNVAKLDKENVFTKSNSFNYITSFNNFVSIESPSRSTTPCGFIALSTDQYGASIDVKEPGSTPELYDKGYVKISDHSIVMHTIDNELDEDSYIIISPVSAGQYIAGVLRIYDNDTDYRKDPVLIDTRNKKNI